MNRKQRRAEAKNRTRFVGKWQGRPVSWKPTQVPEPLRIRTRRIKNKVARQQRKVNR